MKSARRLNRWLGLSPQPTAVGVTLGPEDLVVVALQANPLTLVGLARRASRDGLVVDGNVRLPQRAIGLLEEMRGALGLPLGSECVVSIDPMTRKLAARFVPTSASEPMVGVHQSRFDRATYVTGAAGFRPMRVDITPASLARLALVEYPETAVLRSAGGWSIAVDGDTLDAAWRNPPAVGAIHLGPDMGRCERPSGLSRIAIPAELAGHVDLESDATAIGAALALFGLHPLVAPAPRSPSVVDAKLTIEPVPVLRPNEQPRESLVPGPGAHWPLPPNHPSINSLVSHNRGA